VLEPIRRVEAICAKHKIPPAAASLQFLMRYARIASTVCGISRPEGVAQTFEWATWRIPDEAWEEIDVSPT
jgi:D-threo-aldose 1-dehydrogenase